MHPAEDCLVGHWVGRKRWLLLDLTAAGSDWGPAFGGDGVVNKHSMPRVANYFGQLSEDKKSETGAKGRGGDFVDEAII